MIHNHEVPGSIPGLATKIISHLQEFTSFKWLSYSHIIHTVLFYKIPEIIKEKSPKLISEDWLIAFVSDDGDLSRVEGFMLS